MTATTYTCGEWTIDRDNYGIDHGIEWGLWHGGKLISTSRTLKAAKRHAWLMGARSGEWVKGRVEMALVVATL